MPRYDKRKRNAIQRHLARDAQVCVQAFAATGVAKGILETHVPAAAAAGGGRSAAATSPSRGAGTLTRMAATKENPKTVFRKLPQGQGGFAFELEYPSHIHN
jgi:hypothetical protein